MYIGYILFFQKFYLSNLFNIHNEKPFFVARSKETCVTWHGVVVPLLRYTGEECVSKAIPVFAVAGGAVIVFLRGGRATRKERKHQTFSRNFDCTKGYQGEDISPD